MRFTTAAALVHELMEARDEKRPLRLQKQSASCELLIVDELGFVPLSKTGAELLLEVFSQRYERTSTLLAGRRIYYYFPADSICLACEHETGSLCNRLRYSSEGGNLRPGVVFRAFGSLPRPGLWLPYLFTSIDDPRLDEIARVNRHARE